MQNLSSISYKTKCAITTSILLWASAFVGIRMGLQGGYTPGALALFRFLIASICMLVIYIKWPIRHKLPPKDIVSILLIGATTLGGYHIALNYGELSVPSGIASFIISQSPMLTAVLAICFLGERLTLFAFLGMLVSVMGIGLIALGQHQQYHLDISMLYIFIATVAGSIMTVIQKPYLVKYHAIEVTAYLIWGSVLPLGIYLPELVHSLHIASPLGTGAAIYLGIFPAAIAYVAWSYALREMPVSRASNFMYFMPVLATFLGWVLLSEVPAVMSLLGGLIALVGVWIINNSYRKSTN